MNGYPVVSKAEFKPKALEYLRLVEHQRMPVVISHRGKPVVKLVPVPKSKESGDELKALRGSAAEYKQPFAPVGAADWEILKS